MFDKSNFKQVEENKMPDKKKEDLVVVGNGMAGAKLVEELLIREPDKYSITIIGDEPHGNYDRIKLVYKLKDDDVEDFWINPPEWYEKNNINAVLDERIVKIDKENNVIYETNIYKILNAKEDLSFVLSYQK